MRKKVLAIAWLLLLCCGFAACAEIDYLQKSQPASVSLTSSSQASTPALSASSSVAEVAPVTGINMLTGGQPPEGMQQGQRPVAVVVDNSEKALPQRGLSAADVLYELPVERGKTRLLAVYADYRTLPQIGPVGIAQDQFVQMALPSNAILSHVGTSIYAKNLLKVLNYKTVDGIFVGASAFWFDEGRNRPNEYSWFTDASLLWTGMEAVDVNPAGNVPPLFAFSAQKSTPKEDAYHIVAEYSEQAKCAFVLEQESGLYKKYIFNGQAHADEDGTWLSFTNVFLLNVNKGTKPDELLPEFDFSEGTGTYYTNGSLQPIHWKKGDPNAPLQLFTEDGEELLVQQGKSYIGFVPAEDGRTDYESKEQFDGRNAAAQQA